METKTHIFSDDLARDIKAAFDHAISKGSSVSEASRYVLELFTEGAERYNKSDVLYLCLATLQLEHGCVDNNVREKALAIIERDQNRKGPRFLEEKVLSSLKEDLQRSIDGR